MNVVHVVRQFHPSVGGLEGAVLALCHALVARGVAARVVTLDRVSSGAVPGRLPAEDAVQGIPVRRIPSRGSSRYPVAPRVLGCIGDADVVHVHGIDFFYDFLAATRPLHRRPLVASTHGGFFHTAFARRLKQLYFHTVTRTAARAYDAICASSESDFALFRPVAGAALVLAANGVDVAKWRDRGSRMPKRRLLYIGRFSSNKNLEALMPVLRALRGRHPEWSLTIAGQPWDVTAASLMGRARDDGVADAVTIQESPSDDAIAAAVATASYVVSPSRHEGFGISIVEGMSAGLVPVLSPIPAFMRLIADARGGILADFADPAAAAGAIEALHARLCADPAGARAAVMRAAMRHSWDATADVVLRCYERAVGGYPSPQSHLPLRSLP